MHSLKQPFGAPETLECLDLRRFDVGRFDLRRLNVRSCSDNLLVQKQFNRKHEHFATCKNLRLKLALQVIWTFFDVVNARKRF